MTRKFTNDTFEQAFIFMKCSRKTASNQLDMEIEQDVDGLTVMQDQTIMIWIDKAAGDDVLVHEAVHAAMFTLERAGVEKLDTEVCAYLAQSIWRRCKC